MNRFRCCDSCSRHVLVSEQTCPFCKTPLTAAVQAPRLKVPAGLSRAQRLALAAAVAGTGAVAGCAETTATPVYGAPVPAAGTGATPPNAGTKGGQVAGTSASDGGRAQPVYGAPVPIYGAPAPVYGAPIAGQPSKPNPKDAAVDEDGGPAADAGVRDGGPVAHPVYGAPIPLYGAPAPQPQPKK